MRNNIIWLLVLLLSLSYVTIIIAEQQEFDPYALHSGLVSAVAGRDYVVIASDTRLTSGRGYNILERHHTSSRLWATSTSSSSSSSSSSNSPLAPDGSIQIDLSKLDYRQSGQEKIDKEESTIQQQQQQQLQLLHETTSTIPPDVWVACCGCQPDCEELKRTIRSKIRAAKYFGEISTTISTETPDQIAVLLSNTLYMRRFFPYYSFCILAAIGHVYVYDAIGSYEQVAATCQGTGKELMQPILDRQFRSIIVSKHVGKNINNNNNNIDDDVLLTTTKTNNNNIPVPQVDCISPEDVVKILLNAYRSVSEREITVGDNVIFVCLQRNRNNNYYTTKIWTGKLKKH